MPKRSRRHKPQPANTLASVDSKPSLLDAKSPPAAPEMAEVLSLAELEKHPVSRDRYISTLPYFRRDFSWHTKDWPACECTVEAKSKRPSGCKGCKAGNAFARRQTKAIKTTAKRWVWFSNARKVDDERGERLGTLGYFPSEIRQEIFRIVYEYEHCWAIHRKHEGWPNSKGRYSDLWLHHGRDPHSEIWPDFQSSDPHSWLWGINGLRFASPSTKAEFDHLCLSRTSFWFDCPLKFTTVLKKFPTIQHSQLRSVTFSLFQYCYNCDHLRYNVSRENLYDHKDWYRKNTLDWMALFANLPPGLTSLEFELGSLPWPTDRMETFQNAWTGLKMEESFHHLLGLMIALSKQARRRSPGVHLKWATEDKEYWSFFVLPVSSQGYLEMLDDVCKDPDKWSEEWLDGCEKAHEGCEMVVNWRRLKQDGNAMSPARKSQEVS